MTEDPRDDMKPGDEAPPGTESAGEDVCPRCNGEGTVEGTECPDCGGDGRVIRVVGGA